MKSFLKYNWPSILWAAIIFYLCMVPGSGLPKIKIPHLDKIVHFTFYFIFVLLLNFGWRKQQSFSVLHKNAFLTIFILACCYGLMIEVCQETFTTDRHFEWADEGVNSLGALAGSLLAVKIFK